MTQLISVTPESEPEPDLPALSKNAAAVYKILMALEPFEGMTGPELINKLRNQDICIENSTLTSRIIPELEPYGIENSPRKGYRIPLSKRRRQKQH